MRYKHILPELTVNAWLKYQVHDPKSEIKLQSSSHRKIWVWHLTKAIKIWIKISINHRRVTWGGREREARSPPCPFFGDWKKVSHLWVKFLIWSAIFKSFQGEKTEIFPCGAFLFLDVCLSKCSPRKPSCPRKFLVTRLNHRYSFPLSYSWVSNGRRVWNKRGVGGKFFKA